jgi:hypothetical protein
MKHQNVIAKRASKSGTKKTMFHFTVPLGVAFATIRQALHLFN